MGRFTWPVIGVGVAALAAGTAFAGTQYTSRASIGTVEPAPGAAVRTAQPEIAFRTSNVDRLSDVKVLVNGRDRTDLLARDGEGRLILRTAKLKEGRHTVDARISTRNLFARNVSQQWDFEIDTTAPVLKVARPAEKKPVNRRSVPVTGTTEPDSTVTVRWPGGSRTATSRANGAFATAVPLKEGATRLTIVSRDRAGNTTRIARSVTVDTKAPGLVVGKVPTTMTETDMPLFTGEVTGDDPASTTITATINGRAIAPVRSDQGAEGTDEPTVSFTDNRFQLSVGTLPQGRNTVVIAAVDPAGNRTQKKHAILVDSTEEFGSKDMREGARGEDVKALQQGLADRGFKRVKATGTYDARTTWGVRRYQAVHKMSQNGIFGPRTREAYVGKIVVTLSKYRLQLFRDGKVVKTYKVAIGAPGYSTPTGSYRVVNKQVDPAWFPPDSPWAKGLGPIPPGPGNPLGTRWIGTSAPAIGIHGTYASGSIGTAASHGCIRMHIPEVEELFEEVAVGMPVILNP